MEADALHPQLERYRYISLFYFKQPRHGLVEISSTVDALQSLAEMQPSRLTVVSRSFDSIAFSLGQAIDRDYDAE